MSSNEIPGSHTSAGLPRPLVRIGNTSAEDSLPADAPHILLALDQFPATLGGGERILLRIASLLPQYGFRVSVLTLGIDPASPVLQMPLPCPIYLLPLSRTWDSKAVRAAFALRKFLVEQRIRLVQTFFESSDLWVGSVAKTVPGMRLVWSRRDMGILRAAKHREAYRLLARMPDRVFAVSEQVRLHAIEADHVPADRVQTVYNGVEIGPPPQRQRKSAGERFNILSIGNIRHVKGYDVLLEAAAIVLRRHPQVSFTVAGEVLEPIHFAQLEERLQGLNLGEQFQFIGGVSGSSLKEHLQSADLFVLPSRSEGFSNAILEAMSSALPVVATKVGGNAEAIGEGSTGFLVPPEDPAALAVAIARIVEDREAGRKMGLAGYEKALRQFSTAAMMKLITDNYNQMLTAQVR